MIELLDPLLEKYGKLQKKLSEGDIDYSSKEYREMQKEYNRLEKIIELKKHYEKIQKGIIDTKELLKDESDEELTLMSEEELKSLEHDLQQTEKQIKLSIIPPDPNDDKNTIIEIRSGAGGDEASIFVGDLYRMYSMYGEKYKFKIDVMDSNSQEAGGYKEIVLSIEGTDVYSKLKYESGVHRVQRVPKTESQGRIHTSTVTVAVLPEDDEDSDIQIGQDELKIETTRAQGAGGQHVNKTESAIKMTHIPTGIIVHCQDQRSQHQNKEKAFRILKAKVKEKYDREKKEELDSTRKSQIGSGDRAEKIRTYNFPQNRITDHRIGLTLYNLDRFMDGDIEEVIEKLSLADKEELLADFLKKMKE